MIKIIRKTKSSAEVFLTEEEFEELMKSREYKIVALKNNALSEKYFEDDSKYLIFNIQFGIEKRHFANSLLKENLVDEIIIIK